MLVFGDIIPDGRLRQDFERGTEWVFTRTRDGPQLFRRDGSGLLRRQRFPQILKVIDVNQKLIAICEDCSSQIFPLPCDWKWRYLRDSNLVDTQISAFDGYNPPPSGGDCPNCPRSYLARENIYLN